MALTWEKVIDWAKSIRGETEAEFRAVLAKHGIKSAVCTNWKGGRPIPVERYQLFSELFGKSMDELHGKKPSSSARGSTPIYPNADSEAKFLAAEICQLDRDERDMLTAMVNVLVAKKKKAEAAAKRTDVKKTPKQKPSQRPNA